MEKSLRLVGVVPNYPIPIWRNAAQFETWQGNSLQFVEFNGLNCNPDNSEQVGHFAIQHFSSVLLPPHTSPSMYGRTLTIRKIAVHVPLNQKAKDGGSQQK